MSDLVGRSIVQLPIPQLVHALNSLYADEWLAYYQYWVGARLATGIGADVVSREMEQHAHDEHEHATALAERILQIGGTPLLSPMDWFTETRAGFLLPSDSQVRILLQQNIAGEGAAIRGYESLLEMVSGKDAVTEHLARKHQAKEVEHEFDLSELMEDLGVA